ncbi:hypothetical protein QYF36_006713 [Acer negundo]|nr:hypothetical protein QYF36_006713 [Acer negundo]
MKEFSRSSFKLERASSMGHGRSLDSGGGLLLGTRSISARFAGYKRLSKSMRLNTSESDHYNDNKFDNQCYGSTTEENKKKKKKKKKNLSFKFISKVFSFNKKNHTTSSSDCEDGMCQRLDVNGTQEKKKKKNFSKCLIETVHSKWWRGTWTWGQPRKRGVTAAAELGYGVDLESGGFNGWTASRGSAILRFPFVANKCFASIASQLCLWY